LLLPTLTHFLKKIFITLCTLFTSFTINCFSEYLLKKGDNIIDLSSVITRILQIADVKKLPVAARIRVLEKCLRNDKDPITGIDGELRVESIP
jgi:hypothetical protein